MKRRVLLAVLLLSVPVFAQPHHTMPIVVESTRVLIGTEFVPRSLAAPQKLIVPVGQTVDFPTSGTFDYIEVSGTLKASRTIDTAVNFTTFIIMPGGTLDVGTQADPMPCGRTFSLTVRNVPIDTATDPFQWGNGLLNFGKQTRVGCDKTAWGIVTGDLAAGATSLTLENVPEHWTVGDELLIPDTEQPAFHTTGRRESTVKIATINGATVTLTKPLDFAHPSIMRPDGPLVLRPRVANLTRNIKIQSENQFGTRGHVADIGAGATFDVRYNEMRGLGRTLNVALDDTILGTKIGTNQRGKYGCLHGHHDGSIPGSAFVGNSCVGHPTTTKWGVALHATSDVLVERNVVVDFPGANIVTEDGYEVRNVFRQNFAVGSFGNLNDAQVNIRDGCPGCEGNGIWARGIQNVWEGNENWNNIRGILFINQQFPAGLYPSAPGGLPDTPIDGAKMKALRFADNVTAANGQVGYEAWATPPFPNERPQSVLNTEVQIFAIVSDHISMELHAPTLMCKEGTNGIGLHSALAYVATLDIKGGGYIGGCAVSVARGGGKNYMILAGSPATPLVMQSEVNIDLFTRITTLDNVIHKPLGTHPKRYILFEDGLPIWPGVPAPLPVVGDSKYLTNRGSTFKVINWQQTGDDYLLFFRQSLGNNPSWYSAASQHSWNTPIIGLTMQQSWDQYGLAYRGDVLKPTEAVELEGLGTNGVGRKTLNVAFPVPRAPCSFPTLRAPAQIISGGYVTVFCQITGDPSAASDIMALSVDNDPPYYYAPGEFTVGDDRRFNTDHTGVGLHTVDTWRTKKDDLLVEVPGSRLTLQYCVAATGQTTCAQQPVIVTVPNVVGQTQAAATAALTTAKLVVGTVAQQESTGPVGVVLAQTPAAGMQTPEGSAVNLVVSKAPPPPQTVPVPNVVGQAEAAARSTIIAAQLVVGTVTNQENAAPVGQVIAQTPAATTVVVVGTAVNLVLSSGPPPPAIMLLPLTVTVQTCDASTPPKCFTTTYKVPQP